MAGICARSAIHSITACSLRVNDRVNEFIVFETGERLNARPGIGVYALSLSLCPVPRGTNHRVGEILDGGMTTEANPRETSAAITILENLIFHFHPGWKHAPLAALPNFYDRFHFAYDSPLIFPCIPPFFLEKKERKKNDQSISISISLWIYMNTIIYTVIF